MSNEEKPQSPLASAGPWDKVSAGYDKFTRGFLGKYSEKGLAEFELRPEMKLLDVACGPGTTSLLACSAVGSIEAVDFSESMVSIFREHIRERGLEKINVRVADGQSLPFQDEVFDRAVSMFGLMFFPDRVKGMREIFRCLKKGGQVLLSSWAPVSMSPLMQLMFEAAQAANPDTPPPVTNLESLENPDVFANELERAGFVNIRVKPCICTYDYLSAEQLWNEMVEGAVPLVMARERMSVEAWDTYSAQCLQYVEQAVANRPTLGSTAYLAFAGRD